MSDVIGLDGKSFKPEEEEDHKEALPPCEELVDTLKALLADAEGGTLRAMLVITRHSGAQLGRYESKYTGDFSDPVPHLVVGLCDDMKMEYMEQFILAPRFINVEEEE